MTGKIKGVAALLPDERKNAGRMIDRTARGPVTPDRLYRWGAGEHLTGREVRDLVLALLADGRIVTTGARDTVREGDTLSLSPSEESARELARLANQASHLEASALERHEPSPAPPPVLAPTVTTTAPPPEPPAPVLAPPAPPAPAPLTTTDLRAWAIGLSPEAWAQLAADRAALLEASALERRAAEIRAAVAAGNAVPSPQTSQRGAAMAAQNKAVGEANDAKVLAVLAKRPLIAIEVARELGVPPQTAHNALKRLLEAGRVRRTSESRQAPWALVQ